MGAVHIETGSEPTSVWQVVVVEVVVAVVVVVVVVVVALNGDSVALVIVTEMISYFT